MKKHTAKLLLSTLSLACTQVWADIPSAQDYVPIQKAQEPEKQAEKSRKKRPLKYPITIQTDNQEVKAMLEEHLPLITQQEEDCLLYTSPSPRD